MEHVLEYVDLSRLCNHTININNIDVTAAFKTFLSTCPDRIWMDNEKNRIWKYFIAHQSTSHIINTLHPFVVNYKLNDYMSFINLHVYYLVCLYIGMQFNFTELLHYSTNVLNYIDGNVTLKHMEDIAATNGILMKLINMFVNYTDILVCYHKQESNEPNTATVNASNNTINIYNPHVRVVDANSIQKDDSEDGDKDDDTNGNGTVANNRDEDDDDNHFITNDKDLQQTNDPTQYEFYFVNDLLTLGTLPNDKRVFVATHFSIKSNGTLYAEAKVPHTTQYTHHRHVVSLMMVLSTGSNTFVELLQASYCRDNAIYVCIAQQQLYVSLTNVLAKLKCFFIVESITCIQQQSQPMLYIAFDDIKSKTYKGNIQDIYIDLTFCSEHQ